MNDIDILDALDAIIDALKKQRPRRPVNMKILVEDMKSGHCPICGEGMNSEFKYCGNCGQRLDWKD